MYKVLFTCIIYIIYLLYVETDLRSERELKKMKRKITAIVLATAMCLGALAGCGKKDEPANETNASQDSEVDLDALLDEAVDEHIEAAQAEAEANPEPDLPHYDCTDLVLNADPGDGYIQIADMVFQLGEVMTPDDVRKVVEGSSTGFKCVDSTDDLGFKTVDVQDKYGETILGLSWVYYEQDAYSLNGIERNDLEESTNLLTKIDIMPDRPHDWVDYHSCYYAGGIESSMTDDMSYSADMSTFPYKTKDEYIEHLRNEGFLSEEELEAKEAETGVVDPLQGYYEEDSEDTSKLYVYYPCKPFAEKTVWKHKFMEYTFTWNINGDELTKINMFRSGRQDKSKKPQ